MALAVSSITSLYVQVVVTLTLTQHNNRASQMGVVEAYWESTPYCSEVNIPAINVRVEAKTINMNTAQIPEGKELLTNSHMMSHMTTVIHVHTIR